MTIRIELTTGGPDDALDAAALIAFLVTRYPDAAERGLAALEAGVSETVTVTERVGDIERTESTRRPVRVVTGYVEPSAEQRDEIERRARELFMPDEAGAPLPDAPVTMTPEQAFGGATVDLDAEGLPWDERIHSSNHKRSANGVWMKRRGVAVEIDQNVRAELRQTYPAPAAQPTPAERTLQAAVAEGLIPRPPVAAAPAAILAPPPAAAPVIPAPPTVPAPPAEAPSPAAASVPTAPAATPEAPGSSPEPFDKAFTRIMQSLAGPEGYQKRGLITVEETNGILADVGLGKLSDMLAPANHAKIPEFEAALTAFVAARGA